MPITNHASYIPTMNLFLSHWAKVDLSLPPGLTLNLPDNTSVSRADFTAYRDSLDAQAISLIDCLNDQQIARGDIELRKPALLLLLNEFNGLLDGYYSGTPFINARPKVPNVTDGQDKFLGPMRDAASVWTKLNAAPAPAGITLPLALSSGMDVAGFQAQVAALTTAYTVEKDKVQSLQIARAIRDQTMALVYETMKKYRVVVPSRCTQSPQLVATLPALTPAGGHTPDPVNASAVFEAPDKSKVMYDASPDAALEHYELRGNPGDTYDDDDAVIIATNLPGAPREFLTNFSLNQPGTQVAMKVYVVLKTGNEAGSATMVVQRPL
jgi:hypothetical protein